MLTMVLCCSNDYTYVATVLQFKVAYLRRVNPNRVHLATDLTVDEQGGTVVSSTLYLLYRQYYTLLLCFSAPLDRSNIACNMAFCGV